jgi:glutamine cyclotransferase
LPTPLPATPPPTPRPTTTTISPTEDVITATILGSYELIETVSHDSTAFTQGLEVLSYERLKNAGTNNTSTTTTTTTTTSKYMIESTGQYGQSTIRIVDLSTNGPQVIDRIGLDDAYFGEGCTSHWDPRNPNVIQIYQITWLSGTGFIYTIPIDVLFDNDDNTSPTLTHVGTFDIDTTTGEGWGIAYHPILQQFIVSDGSDNLHFWELSGDGVFQTVRTVPVTRRLSSTEDWVSLFDLNELEYDPQNPTTILANVWYEDYIVRIDLSTGKVTHQYDLSTLDRPNTADVLNGIAAVWDSRADDGIISSTEGNHQFWVTGKYWPSMYRIRFVS